jgi:hypothetical protein
MVVDLPAPLGPTKPVTCPGLTVNDIPSSATVDPKRLRRPVTSMVAALLISQQVHSFGLREGGPTMGWPP